MAAVMDGGGANLHMIFWNLQMKNPDHNRGIYDTCAETGGSQIVICLMNHDLLNHA